jgi:hypothetical protein
MTWAQRLKRVFGIDIVTCPACGGAMRMSGTFLMGIAALHLS